MKIIKIEILNKNLRNLKILQLIIIMKYKLMLY